MKYPTSSPRIVPIGIVTAATLVAASLAPGQTVTVGNAPTGTTPLQLGFNAGNYYPGSNTAAWAQYSGVNAFRIFASAAAYEPSSQTGLQSGSGIASLSAFDSRKAALRADPEAMTYTNWNAYNSHFDNLVSGTNQLKLDPALGSLTGIGISPILQLTRGLPEQATWANKWDQWHFYYVMAYHAAKDYGVTQFQSYNEPDHPDADGNPAIAPADWLAGMKLASDAVRSAVQDVNAKFGKALPNATLSGPTGNGSSAYALYGKPAITTNRTDYGGRAVNYDVLNTFDMHRYGTSASSFVNDINAVRTAMTSDSPTHAALPITYTEFNSRTTSSYAGSTDTPDTPSMFTGVATDVLAAMSAGVSGMYAFKFNQTPDASTGGDAVQKTGFYYTDNANAPYNTLGSTLAAESMRLVTRAFKGQRPTYGTTGTVSGYTVATSYDAGSKNYYVMGVDQNAAGGTTGYTLDLSSWGIAAGTVVSVEEVSTRRHGEVAQLFSVPANGRLTISQPAQSVWLLTVPTGPAVTPTVLTPVGDTQVRNGTSAGGTNFSTQNFSKDVYGRVGRSDTDATGDYATYMKFDLGKIDPANVNRAIFQVTGQVFSGSPITFHVYALTGAAGGFDASTLTWNNAPDLLGATDAQLLGVGDTAFPVGSLTYTAGLSTSGLDITEFLRLHPESIVSFVLIREGQFAGDVDTSYVRLSTSESATPPTLMVFSNVPEPTGLAALGVLGLTLLRRRRGYA